MRQIVFFWIVVALSQANAQDCDQRVLVKSGINNPITSPNYPDQYPGNKQCTYYLYSRSASNHITITFESFHMEEHRSCAFDYLAVYDGPTANSDLLAKLCGSSLPSSFTSTGKHLTLLFRADASIHGDGFKFKFTSGCNFEYTEQSNQIKSPGYPSNYPDSSRCTYSIAPPSGNQILLTFQNFEVEFSDQCNFDYVQLVSKPSNVSLGRFCGRKTTFKKLVNSTNMVVNFISDRSVSRSGFLIDYRVSTDCSVNNGGCSHHCNVASPGVVVCSCDPGFQLNQHGVLCEDIDECQSSPCSEVCINAPGYFNCSCSTPGYLLSPDGISCTDMTCKINNGGCEHICQPFGHTQYHCACNAGYILSSDAHNCSDIDECNTTITKYRHHCEQICVNQGGSYYCLCNEGYELSPNGRTCRDVDECAEHGHVCEHRCVNQEGSWGCGCFDGFQPIPDNNTYCEDIDECSNGIAPSTCAQCINHIGTYVCICENGYNSNDDNTGCVDIDECDGDDNGGCQQVCINRPGYFTCSCQVGYEPPSNGSSECRDNNECIPNNGRGPCDHYCENLPGSFECACVGGYKLLESGISCQDIDECATDNGGCQQQCNNVPGTFNCQCFVGYETVDGTCTDIDECISYPCDPSVDSECTNSNGSFVCDCPAGFRSVNVTICEDIDECATDQHGCPQICDNVPGSYDCQCERGYTKVNENECIDINECSQNPCHHVCVNMVGSFQCFCDEGHYLLADGYNCSDVDECRANISHCEHICVNNIGFYSCKCRPGFTLNADNFTCTDIDECGDGSAGCSDGCINARGSFWCHCPTGYTLGVDKKTCEDINECLTNNGSCDHACTNTNGSFSCGCNYGYVFDGQFSCSDIDECASNNGGCNQTCTNLDGSYECSCGPTFRLGTDSHRCENCPSCVEFQQLAADVANTIQLATAVDHLRQSNHRLSASVSALQARVEALEAIVSPK